jgi:prepilin-type N-terminal cleavage/methylation domain-containing protein
MIKKLNAKRYTLYPKTSGFTLIELLLTTVIIVVLSFVGFTYIVGYKQRQALSSSSREIVAVVRNAQDRSISQESGSRWGVHFSNPPSGEDFYDLFRGTSYPTAEIITHEVLPSTVEFETPAAGSSSTVVFSPLSGLPDNFVTVRIILMNDSSVSSTIVINSSGEISF